MLFSRILLSLISAILMCSTAIAHEFDSNPTLSLGFQKGGLGSFSNLHGSNVKLQYETSLLWGVMGSYTQMKNNWQDESDVCRIHDKKCSADYNINHAYDKHAEYYSWMAGPTYRVSNNLSLFALAGISHAGIGNPVPYTNNGLSTQTMHYSSSNQFSYSAGLMLKASDKLLFTAGYEGSHASYEGSKLDMKSLFIDVGYQF